MVARRNVEVFEDLPPQLLNAIAHLENIKRRSEQFRRFGEAIGHRNPLVQIEGDIEEWLIQEGYWESTE